MKTARFSYRDVSQGHWLRRSAPRLLSAPLLNLSAIFTLLLISFPLVSVSQTSRKVLRSMEAGNNVGDRKIAYAIPVRVNAGFALRLCGQLRAQAKSYLSSSDSLSTAFDMALSSVRDEMTSRGKVASGPTESITFTFSPKQLLPVAAKLLAEVSEKLPDYKLIAAHELLAQENQNYLQAYRKLAEEGYAHDLHRISFEHSPESLYTTMNRGIGTESESTATADTANSRTDLALSSTGDFGTPD